jgi:hypothetical protein
MWATSVYVDYPWVVDPEEAILAPGGFWPGPDGWNLTAMGTLTAHITHESSVNNISGVIYCSNAMNVLGNEEVMYLWTFYPETFQIMTTNIQGFYYNSALYDTFQYFAPLY